MTTPTIEIKIITVARTTELPANHWQFSGYDDESILQSVRVRQMQPTEIYKYVDGLGVVRYAVAVNGRNGDA